MPRAGRVQALVIGRAAPPENGYVESSNGRLRDEHLSGERFDTLLAAQVLVEAWRNEYNQVRPHFSLGYRSLGPGSRGRAACPRWRIGEVVRGDRLGRVREPPPAVHGT